VAEPIIALGIDPGLAKTGIGAVARYPDGSYQSRGVRVSRSEPGRDHKFFNRVRAAQEDQRRIREHWVMIRNSIQIIQPHAIGIENYLTFEPKDVIELREAAGKVLSFLGTSVPTIDDLKRVFTDTMFLVRFAEVLAELAAKVSFSSKGIGLGQAAKTIAVFGAAMGAAFTAGVPVFVFQPSDIKKFGGKRGASKEEVGTGLEMLVFGLKEQMAEKVPQKTLKEHAWDATGHAILAADEFAGMQVVPHGLTAS
jgi:Holliday junction resolvasome RuvABC endonuclease subunit